MARSGPRIFLNYRREDSAGYTGRLFDSLVEHFGRDAVFMDVDTISPGLDFVEVIDEAVRACDVMLTVIGHSWLTIADSSGRPRLKSPNDFVRLEIATGLERGLRVIPLLVGGATMPRESELPKQIGPLARRHALELMDRRWSADMRDLVSALEATSRSAWPPIADSPLETVSVPAQTTSDRVLAPAPVPSTSAAPSTTPVTPSTPVLTPDPARTPGPVHLLAPPADGESPPVPVVQPPVWWRQRTVLVAAPLLVLAVVVAIVLGTRGATPSTASRSAAAITTPGSPLPQRSSPATVTTPAVQLSPAEVALARQLSPTMAIDCLAAPAEEVNGIDAALQCTGVAVSATDATTPSAVFAYHYQTPADLKKVRDFVTSHYPEVGAPCFGTREGWCTWSGSNNDADLQGFAYTLGEAATGQGTRYGWSIDSYLTLIQVHGTSPGGIYSWWQKVTFLRR